MIFLSSRTLNGLLVRRLASNFVIELAVKTSKKMEYFPCVLTFICAVISGGTGQILRVMQLLILSLENQILCKMLYGIAQLHSSGMNKN